MLLNVETAADNGAHCCLSYYAGEDEAVPKGVVPLRAGSFGVTEPKSARSKPHTFRLNCGTFQDSQKWILSAESHAEMESWKAAFAAIEEDHGHVADLRGSFASQAEHMAEQMQREVDELRSLAEKEKLQQTAAVVNENEEVAMLYQKAEARAVAAELELSALKKQLAGAEGRAAAAESEVTSLTRALGDAAAREAQAAAVMRLHQAEEAAALQRSEDRLEELRLQLQSELLEKEREAGQLSSRLQDAESAFQRESLLRRQETAAANATLQLQGATAVAAAAALNKEQAMAQRQELTNAMRREGGGASLTKEQETDSAAVVKRAEKDEKARADHEAASAEALRKFLRFGTFPRLHHPELQALFTGPASPRKSPRGERLN